MARYGNETERVQAIRSLSGSTNNDVVNILKALTKDRDLSENIKLEAEEALKASLKEY